MSFGGSYAYEMDPKRVDTSTRDAQVRAFEAWFWSQVPGCTHGETLHTEVEKNRAAAIAAMSAKLAEYNAETSRQMSATRRKFQGAVYARRAEGRRLAVCGFSWVGEYAAPGLGVL